MSCFICDIQDQALFNVQTTRSSYTKTPLCQIINQFIKKNYEFEIFEDDAICHTCQTLVDELDKLYHQADDIEHVLLKQVCRKYDVETSEPLIYKLVEKDLSLFNLRPFLRQNLYRCTTCPFTTAFEDCIVPHSKLHDLNAVDNNSKCDETPDVSVYCEFCDECFPNEHLLTFHIELFHGAQVLVKLENDVNAGPWQESLLEPVGVCDNNESVTAEDAEGIAHEFAEAEDMAEMPIEGKEYYRCPLCDSQTDVFENMKDHVQSKHRRMTRKTAVCQYCDVKLGDCDSIVEHSGSHIEMEYSCSICIFVSFVKIFGFDTFFFIQYNKTSNIFKLTLKKIFSFGRLDAK